jgi:hypothetical protein
VSSSIHIAKVSSGSFLHNDRTQKPSYLIDTSVNNEYSANSQNAFNEYSTLKDEATKAYIERTGQKIQKSTIYLKEAIVNLQEHHTLKDLEPIKEKLEDYGFKVLQMSIHRDEGFKNGDKLEHNYHAHITMFNLTPDGKTVKFGKDYRTELSKLQTFTADTLKMERGKVSVAEHAKEINKPVEKASKRLDTHEYKHAMKMRDGLKKELAQTKKQKDELFKHYGIRRDKIKKAVLLSGRAKKYAYDILYQEQTKDIKNLNEQITELKSQLNSNKPQEEIKQLKEQNEHLRKELSRGLELPELSPQAKAWIQNNKERLEKQINSEQNIAKENTPLTAKFDDKDKVKELGAKWDFDNKVWYVQKGKDLTPFNEFLPPDKQINKTEQEAIKQDKQEPKKELTLKELVRELPKAYERTSDLKERLALRKEIENCTGVTVKPELAEQNEILKERVANIEQTNQILKAENTELKAQNETLEYNFRDTQKRITALETDNKELKKELHALNTQVNKTKNADDIQELYNAIQAQEKTDIKPSAQTVKEAFKNAPIQDIGGMFSGKKEVYTFTPDEAQKLIKSVEENDKKTLSAFEKMTNSLKAKTSELIESAKSRFKSIFEQTHSVTPKNDLKEQIEPKERQIEPQETKVDEKRVQELLKEAREYREQQKTKEQVQERQREPEQKVQEQKKELTRAEQQEQLRQQAQQKTKEQVQERPKGRGMSR